MHDNKQVIRLDFLANFPQNPSANALFTDIDYPNPNTFDNAWIHQHKADSKHLAQMFHKHHAYSFDYSCGEFLSLFYMLCSQGYHIALASSLSQQSFYAAKNLLIHFPQSLSLLIPSKATGMIESINALDSISLAKHQKIAFFLPFINQDLLSKNPIESLIDEILSRFTSALIICDISLYLSALSSQRMHFLHKLCFDNVIFMCNAEHIGLMRKSGFMLACAQHLALQGYFATQLLRPKLFASAIYALEDILSRTQNTAHSIEHLNDYPRGDSKEIFFCALQSHLGDDISLFVPLAYMSENALALRFRGIKARLLIQSLQVERIYAINGQDCLFGNAKPSFVLDSMGYDEQQCRELLSVSYQRLEDIESLAHKIANAYLQLRQFNANLA